MERTTPSTDRRRECSGLEDERRVSRPRSPSHAMSRPAPLPLPDHPRCFAVASIVIGRDLAWRDRKASRRWRKLRVLERQLADLRRESPELPTLTDLSGVKLETTITDEQARTLAVDLAFSDPYAPYELGYSERDFVKSFHQSATDVLLSDRLVDRVLTIKEEAMKAHAGFFSSRLKLALAGISSAAVLPFIPAFLGAAVGVAVTSQSIALLHAGSLAASSAPAAAGSSRASGRPHRRRRGQAHASS